MQSAATSGLDTNGLILPLFATLSIPGGNWQQPSLPRDTWRAANVPPRSFPTRPTILHTFLAPLGFRHPAGVIVFLAQQPFAAEREDRPTLRLSFDIHQTVEVFHLKG